MSNFTDENKEKCEIESEQICDVCIVFDGPPSHKSGRFVEVEDSNGNGISIGKWRKRDDDLWSLDIHAVQNLQHGERKGEHMHGVDVCAYCAEGDIAKKEIVRQEKHAADDLNSIYRHHTCDFKGCEVRAEYMVGDGSGRTLLVCEHHYSTETPSV